MSFRALIEAKLKAMGQEYTVQGVEIKTICLNPEHIDHRPSYSINTETGVSHCFSCHYAPHPARLIDATEEDTEELLRQAQYTYLEDQMRDVEDDEQREFFLPPKAYDINKDWRGVSQELLEKLGVYYCDKGRYAGRLVFPIVKDGVVEGFDARIVNASIVPEKLKTVKWIRPSGMKAQAIVYPFEYLKTLNCNHLLLTEGIMDAVSYLELGVPAIPTFGLSGPAPERITQLLELGVETLTIAYDNDEAGKTGAMKVFPDYVKWFDITNHLQSYKVFASGENDCNDYLMKIKGLR